jgi:predicted membrane-bound dolichyl-phosphate-mannose-protein mannosyltransferase/Gpi18-like mannosyltransferase
VNEEGGRDDRRARLVVAGVIAIGVIVRLLAVRAQGFPTDVGTFQAWAERLAQIGPGRFYEPGYFSDYPPAFLYVLWLLGGLFDGELLRLAVKAISIPADIGIALLAARVAWRTAGRTSAIAAAAIWSLQPGVIFAGPYWGQVDAVGTLPLFGSLVAAGSRRWWLAGALAALAALVKPQFAIGLLVIAAAAAFEFIREARWRPVAQTLGAAAATGYVLCVPFWGADPTHITAELVRLVRSAAETYPYTSLYAFNGWSVFFDFWKPDTDLVVWGGVLLVIGLVLSIVPLWWRRDIAMLLACAVVAGLAFYFLPTRAHERYLFPVFALALPLAVARGRVLVPYVVLALAFALSLYYAFTRYQQYVDLRVPDLIEATLFSRNGQIAIALVMIAAAGYLWWRLVRGDARLENDHAWSLPPIVSPRDGRWTLPAALGPGRLPTRRDLTVAVLIALAVLATRGYRLDWPRDMYFDEVYHARTAFELLAQREPYEWTHPHLAKEVMALGILAFGDDRVVAQESVPPNTIVAAVANDGLRVYALADGTIEIAERGASPQALTDLLGTPRGLAVEGDRIFAVTDQEIDEIDLTPSLRAAPPGHLSFSKVRTREGELPVASFAVSGDRIVVGTARSLAIYNTLDAAAPIVVATPTVAVTAKTDGSEIYALDPQGIVHVISAETAQETRALTGGRPGTAIAYALGPNRLFVARADAAILDVYELETGSHDAVPLANARTGTFTSGATALAVVPRTDFLYALDEGRVVVVETHGTSPFASIPVTGSMLGVDGEGDKLVVAGANGADLIETGRHAVAWRIPGVLLAALLAFFLVLLARRLFASAVLPALVGIAVLLDGSMFAQARIGMNDIYVATLIVAGWYFVVAAHRPRRSAIVDIVIAGVLFGLALASKWAGAYTLAGLLVASLAVTARAYERGRPGTGGPLDLLARRGLNAVVLFASFAVIPAAIYLASYVRWFGGPTIPYGWSLVELTQQMYWYHSSLTAPHPAGSPWWSWPLVLKPVYWYFGASSGGDNAYIYDAGNVVLFWAGLVAFFWCAVAAIRARSAPLAFVVFAGLVQYVAWIPIGRVLFFYHFFTVLPFYLLALAAGLAYLWESGRARVVIGYLAAAAAAFAYFYPFISAQPFPGAQAGMFFILPTWTYECTFYPTFVCNPTIGSSFSFVALAGRLALALAVAATVAALLVWSGSPRFARLVATVRSGTRR